ncbi:TPA: tRNA (adenosine(37)-N6)-threonylcarbamoyltransferase complex ATPase subunit type 1 TsaE [candidate division WOR-3 bacterium]|jgi:tRNA threonylcarbamoyl adenosine modification protein YjeE|uniref:tRNA threonylcarbamoyladenosine biosynthesis protein TsaE n=1 Tax=candidate division WOR-3 bacterium TaxID=2052148 RepID=A0A350H8K2_UNCW3|nr:tRNA (adenosine(37)-N6)-threonylcarbamoyltransferase complex ATPase subunit type 1 TsaE [candidate division WOR-3 bacterium]
MQKIFNVRTEEDMDSVSLFIKEIKKVNQIVLLTGELGSGKTALVRRFAKMHGIESVMSPTFNLLHIYSNDKIRISHADLYRIDSFQHIRELNLEEIIEQSDITFIEWAEKGKDIFNSYPAIKIIIEFDKDCRRVEVVWQ